MTGRRIAGSVAIALLLTAGVGPGEAEAKGFRLSTGRRAVSARAVAPAGGTMREARTDVEAPVPTAEPDTRTAGIFAEGAPARPEAAGPPPARAASAKPSPMVHGIPVPLLQGSAPVPTVVGGLQVLN